MIVPGFINYLPNYLIVILISTLLTIFIITIDYIKYSISEGEWKFISKYVKQSLEFPLGFIEFIVGIYIEFCILSTLIYIMISLETMGN